MAKRSKRMRAIDEMVDTTKQYTLEEAVTILHNALPVKFDQSVELAIQLGVDPKKADQLVRGTISLPNGTGKTPKILVFAKGDKIKEALDAGADFAGAEELLEKVKGGWTEFDYAISTPDMMRDVGRLGKILGAKGLMPTPKAGTVTNDVGTAVKEIKRGKIEFKVDKFSLLHNGIGKLSFTKSQIIENAKAFLVAVAKAKPSSSKGIYFLSCTMSSTMGPGLKIDSREIPTV